MNDKIKLFSNTDDSPLGKAAIFVKPAIIAIALILIIMSVVTYLEYSELITEQDRCKDTISRLDGEIEELKYYISAPMDETYVRKFAKEKLGLVPADEKIYFTGSGK